MTDAVEKLVDIAKAILAAIQADPMAYGIKPKPLEWEDGGWNHDEICHTGFGLFYKVTTSDGLWILEKHEGSTSLTSVWDNPEAAKAAAYDDLCARFKEMI